MNNLSIRPVLISKNEDIACVDVLGTFDFERADQGFADLIEKSASTGCGKALWDLSRVLTGLGAGDATRLAIRAGKSIRSSATIKAIAIVGRDPKLKACLRIFGALVGHENLKLRVFARRTDAIAWLHGRQDLHCQKNRLDHPIMGIGALTVSNPNDSGAPGRPF